MGAAEELLQEESLAQVSSETAATDSDDADTSDDEAFEGISGPKTAANIVKNVVGEGMLSLPAGLAAGTGLAAGCLLAAGFAALMSYSFSLMGRLCHVTGEKTNRGCGEALSGPRLAQTMAVVCLLKPAFSCITYAMVIGESASRTARFFGLSGAPAEREYALLILAVLVLLPLCLLRNLGVLSFTSIIGVIGEVFVALFMLVRLLDGSYAEGGRFYELTADRDRPNFGLHPRNDFFLSAATFVLVSSMTTAFIAHYNAPKYFHQLQRRNPRRFTRVSSTAFCIAAVIYLWVMSVGYLTFGFHCEGLILNNYSEKDPMATAARVAMGLAVLFGFPLAFTGFRDSTLQVLRLDGERRRVHYPASVVLLGVVVLLGCLLDDLGLINSLVGAVMGSLITLIFPGLLLRLAWRCKSDTGADFGAVEGQFASLALITLGVVLLVGGTGVSLARKLQPGLLLAAPAL